MREILKSQWKHVACIQDPLGVPLYMQTGTLVKGGHRLPSYRCARGSTSLESFHLHLNRFIPGTLAHDTFFQAYLLDELARSLWARKSSLMLGQESTLQTGKVLQDYKLAIEESETTEVGIEVDEGYAELEEFQDITVPTFDTERTPAASQASVSAASAASSPTPLATSPMSSLSVVSPSQVTYPVTSSMSSLFVVPPSQATSPVSSLLHTQSKPALSLGAHSCEFYQSIHRGFCICYHTNSKCIFIILKDKYKFKLNIYVFHVVPGDQLSAETDLLTSEENTSHDDSVGPENIEGYGAVQDLSEFLVSLREHRLALTGEECVKIITLWQALGEYDKRKTIYSPRHQTTLKQGRFRATKKIVATGVESTKRCFVGAHSPAQWPDCNRVVEAIFTRLCALYSNAVRCDGVRVSRFTMVARAYRHIRECILTNAKVMRETTIQLPEVNAATVTQCVVSRPPRSGGRARIFYAIERRQGAWVSGFSDFFSGVDYGRFRAAWAGPGYNGAGVSGRRDPQGSSRLRPQSRGPKAQFGHDPGDGATASTRSLARAQPSRWCRVSYFSTVPPSCPLNERCVQPETPGSLP
ncbi:uncharacterized protein LOC130550779 [Triplophysa rosa]|uniref:uncharacterized protein LOC130550779 n=1 Tax=Triplophysa rosa TaxID=992332 RepID=UPI002545F5AC|nr:uncharacterized protein LOC130550779 [Triplophysa rosa]